MADLYDRNTGSFNDGIGYPGELNRAEDAVKAIFEKMVEYGYSPSDVALFLTESVYACRMEHSLTQKFTKA